MENVFLGGESLLKMVGLKKQAIEDVLDSVLRVVLHVLSEEAT